MILSDQQHGILTLKLNRPDSLNAFNNALFDALAEALLEAQQSDAVRVVVLTGEGRAFSAGADLSEMGTRTAPPKYGFAKLVEILIDFPKPLITAVNGLGIGVGATFLGLADINYMAASARLRCPFSSLGIVAEAASTYTFPQLMGPQAAAWFLSSGEWLDAAACKAQGLVLDVLPDEGFLAAVQQKAAVLAAMPLSSLTATKKLMRDPHRDAMKQVNQAENAALAGLVGGPANREAIAAFREKRAPDFSALSS